MRHETFSRPFDLIQCGYQWMTSKRSNHWANCLVAIFNYFPIPNRHEIFSCLLTYRSTTKQYCRWPNGYNMVFTLKWPSIGTIISTTDGRRLERLLLLKRIRSNHLANHSAEDSSQYVWIKPSQVFKRSFLFSSPMRQSMTSSQKLSRHEILCFLSRLISQRPPRRFLSSSHIGLMPSWKKNAWGLKGLKHQHLFRKRKKMIWCMTMISGNGERMGLVLWFYASAI